MDDIESGQPSVEEEARPRLPEGLSADFLPNNTDSDGRPKTADALKAEYNKFLAALNASGSNIIEYRDVKVKPEDIPGIVGLEPATRTLVIIDTRKP